MKNEQGYTIIFYTIIALAINLCGRFFASAFTLPVWCDSIGTFMIAYLSGPVCGALVGFTNNIIYGIFVDQQSVYCIVGALLGFVVGHFSKKKVFETQFETMSFGMALAVFSTVVSVMINTIFYEGMSGNIWGNQVMVMCVNEGIPRYLSFFLGQFCVEFLDKLLCAEIVFVLLKLVRFLRKRNEKKRNLSGKLLLMVVLFSVFLKEDCLAAEKEVSEDYNSYIQRTYSKAEGLLSGAVNDIVQTKDGKLWIGTYAGLFKYDGARFSLFQEIDSVKNVNCLYVDEEGRLWVGTNDNGVTILINEHVMNVIDEEKGIRSNFVKDIVCDSLGNYYIGTTEGLSVVSLSGGVEVTHSFDEIQNVLCMSADGNGNVVVVTEHSEVFWIKDGQIADNPIQQNQSLSYSAVYFTTDHRLLFGTTENIVYVYDMESGQPTLMDTIRLDGIEYVNRFCQTEQKEIFVCSDSGAAVLYEDGQILKLNINNFTSSIENMLVDYQGNLWFASSRLGLLEMCKSPFSELFSNINETAVVNTTQIWKDLLYCGTDQGLIIIDEKTECRVNNPISELLCDTRVRCLKADSENALWVATTGLGVFRIRETLSGKYEIKNYTEEDGLPGMRFRNIIECSDGKIMVAGDYGVAVLKDGAVETVLNAEKGLINEKSLCLLEYKDACYVGSDGGGITKIDKDGTVTPITRKDGLSSDVILRMVYDACTDGIFVVTSNALCYISADGQISCLDKFPYSNNFDMVCSADGNCWILSSAGIYVANARDLVKNEKKDYSLINSKRGFHDSLTANAWMYREGNNWYLCCDNGVVKVNADQLDLSDSSYRMILDYVLVDGSRMNINRSDTLQLSSEVNQIVFEPEVLNYSLKDPYVSVYLEGYDKEKKVFRLSQLEKLTYTNLRPGTYVFKIAILDEADGREVESAGYTIEKEIEMYQNWWFKVHVSVVAALVLVWITWFITRARTQKTLIRQKLELEYAKKQIQMGNETILSIARTVDAKDSNTSEHSFRVSEYSVAIAKRLNYSKEKCENLRQIALLHDIGKIGIPDAILNKVGKLTDEEYEIMKTHVIKGSEILKDFTMIDNVALGALYHHEKYDGTGYCHGLKGEEIPLDARIIGIADAFDAMTANRVYRKKLEFETVISELKRCSGTQFDPELVEILLSLIEDGEIDIKALYGKSKGVQKE